jgi:hypothetical protein
MFEYLPGDNGTLTNGKLVAMPYKYIAYHALIASDDDS